MQIHKKIKPKSFHATCGYCTKNKQTTCKFSYPALVNTDFPATVGKDDDATRLTIKNSTSALKILSGVRRMED